MKKTMLIVCSLITIGLAACNSDKPKPTDRPQRAQGEGIYHPQRLISTIIRGDEAPEIWFWQGDTLMYTAESDFCGGYDELMRFGYDGDRVNNVATMHDSASMEVNYNGQYIDRLMLYYLNQLGAQVAVRHNSANKIDHIDVDINRELAEQLANLLLSGELEFAQHPVVRMMSVPVAKAIIPWGKLVKPSNTKLSLSAITVEVDFTWSGNNVATVIIGADVSAGVTMAEVGQVIDLEEYLGPLADVARNLPGEFPLTVSVADTISYDYDNHPNPLQGYMGTVDAAILSANNTTYVDHMGNADVTLTLSLPIVGDRSVSRNMPIALQHSYTIEYDDEGYPSQIIDEEGSSTEYIYK